MAKKIITILGITGKQGASVADVFIREGGWHIRGVTRDPSKPSSKVWADKGVELIKGDMDDVALLKKAFAGSNVIFGQGRNIVDAANATLDTLDRFVLSTLSATKKWSKGKYSHNYHFDAKWQAVEYLKAMYPELAKKTSYLQMALYLTNWKGSTGLPIDGTFVLRIPGDPDGPIAQVDARRDTGEFVKALLHVPAGQNLLGVASSLSWNEFAALWGKHHGVTCRFERLDRKVLEDAIPGGVGEELADMFEYIAEFGYDGGDPTIVLPKDLDVHVPVYTVEEYIKNEDWSSLL
ncbi:Putative NmrA-like domain, NAD(P)-binding domain superfamily [Colletotrichum destructivum]|uniref:NmrA-like domain, NAD(P)-binding domain superfamily n=1 Tax=Colletotrichum destructivum TaxID=34406 RepID=A0AAX4J426_9PEZI|nr:Putative NmrA-like domain, NAD(P)-binding domain superfamily [Colletotrichum destructivum]